MTNEIEDKFKISSSLQEKIANWVNSIRPDDIDSVLKSLEAETKRMRELANKQPTSCVIE